MAMNYRDLDALVPGTITVKLRGKEYQVPGSLDSETVASFLRLQAQMDKVQQEGEGGSPEAAANLLDNLTELAMKVFRVYQPDLDTLPIAPVQISALFTGLMGGDTEQEGEGEDPTSTAKVKRKKRIRSETSLQPSPESESTVVVEGQATEV